MWRRVDSARPSDGVSGFGLWSVLMVMVWALGQYCICFGFFGMGLRTFVRLTGFGPFILIQFGKKKKTNPIIYFTLLRMHFALSSVCVCMEVIYGRYISQMN